MATAVDNTTEIEKEADFLHYMAYPMIKSWNKSDTVGHVFYSLWKYYAPVLYHMAHLVSQNRISPNKTIVGTVLACKIPV